MQTFLMLGKYSSESVKDISANRTDKAVHLIKQLEGKLLSMYALLGGYDMIMIVEFKDLEKAMKASLGLTVLTGISFSTYPAVSVADFDRMIGQ